MKKIAAFVISIKSQTQKMAETIPLRKRATPTERAQDFRRWVAQLPRTGVSLSDEACDRGKIYE